MKKKHIIKKALSLFLCLSMLISMFTFVSFSTKAAINLTMPIIFNDNMVLQREKPITIWGESVAGDTINVALNNQYATAVAVGGEWSVTLPAMDAGGPYKLIIQGDNDFIEYDNVMVGEVWMFAGQSNMSWHVGQNGGGDIVDLMAKLDQYPEIRIFAQGGNTANKWAAARKLSSADNAPEWSQVALFFAAELYDKYQVPIGVIQCAEGNTSVESFMNEDMISNPTVLEPTKLGGGTQALGYSYNRYVEHLVPFTMRGIVFYQGEANNEYSEHSGPKAGYDLLQERLIRSYRNYFNQQDLTFIYTQLPSYSIYTFNGGEYWQYMREEQAKTLNLVDNVGMAVGLDAFSSWNIHPVHKKALSQRLVRNAMALAYGEDIDYKSPSYNSHSVSGNKVTITFKDVGGGLIKSGTYSSYPLHGFQIAGSDGIFVNATAFITDTDKVELTAAGISNPVYIRFHFVQSPLTNLYSEEGLPAAPFRTDSFPFTFQSNSSFGYPYLEIPTPAVGARENQTIVSLSSAANIREAYPSNNYGGMLVGEGVRTLLGFDLTSKIPAGAVITSAYLRGQNADQVMGFSQGASSFDIVKITGVWNPANVTWNTQPTIDANIRYGQHTQKGNLENLEVFYTDLNAGLIQGQNALDFMLLHTGYSHKKEDTNFNDIKLVINYQQVLPASINAVTVPASGYLGVNLNLSSAKINANYADTTVDSVSITDDMISGFGKNQLGSQTVTVSYLGRSTTFNVNIVTDTVASVSMISSPHKTEYFEGENLSLNGAKLNAVYQSGKTEIVNITSAMISGYNKNTLGNQNATVTFGGVTTTFGVNVVYNDIVSIAVITNPTKLNYVENELFDITGMVVQATYVGGATANVTGFAAVNPILSTLGSGVPVAVAYHGRECTVNVNVIVNTNVVNISAGKDATVSHPSNFEDIVWVLNNPSGVGYPFFRTYNIGMNTTFTMDIDLAAVCDISKIEFYGIDHGSPWQYEISLDGTTWTTIRAMSNVAQYRGGSDNSAHAYDEFNTPALARYLRVSLKTVNEPEIKFGNLKVYGVQKEFMVPVTGINRITGVDKTVQVGQQSTARVVVTPMSATFPETVYSSSDDSVISISAITGKWTALKVGTAVITATTIEGEFTDSFEVNVVQPYSLISNYQQILSSKGSMWGTASDILNPNNLSSMSFFHNGYDFAFDLGDDPYDLEMISMTFSGLNVDGVSLHNVRIYGSNDIADWNNIWSGNWTQLADFKKSDDYLIVSNGGPDRYTSSFDMTTKGKYRYISIRTVDSAIELCNLQLLGNLKISSIAIKQLPENITYIRGDKFNNTGMVVEATYKDGSKRAINDYTINVDLDTRGIQTATVNYRGYTETFAVTVNSEIVPGDVSGDRRVIMMDAIILRMYILGGYGITGSDIITVNSDVNIDNTIDMMDVLMIRQYILGGYEIGLALDGESLVYTG